MIVHTTPYRAPVVKPPIVIEGIPRYGMGRLEEYNPRDPMFYIVFGTQHTDFKDNPKFTLPAAVDGNYFYYMAPASFGAATFTFMGFNGGWDGASWPLDDMGDEFGPVEIEIDGVLWHIYRTDWPDSIGGDYSVRFANV